MADDYENKIVDLDEDSLGEVKTEPEILIMVCLNSAIKALNSEDVKAGFLKFTILIETAESIARGMGLLLEEYKEEVDKYAKSIEGSGSGDVVSTKVANKKLELITRSIGSFKPITEPIKA